MIIKICYPNIDIRTEGEPATFPQEYVYEVSAYSVKHIYQRDDPKKFYDIIYSGNGILNYMLPVGLEIIKPLFSPCKCPKDYTDMITKDFEECGCNDFCCVTLITLYDVHGEQIMHPILLQNCKVFITNSEGKTVDRIHVG